MKWKIILIIALGILILGGIMVINHLLPKEYGLSLIPQIKNRNSSLFPQIVITEDIASTDALLNNVTAETNFTHLTIAKGNGLYDNLVGYWNFDGDAQDTAGFTAHDFTDTNNDASAYGNTVSNSTCGVFGSGACFDGNEDYINCGTSSTLKPSRVSYGAWVYAISPGASNVRIIANDNPGTTTKGFYLGRMVDDGSVYYGIGNGGYKDSSYILQLNQWYHFFVTYNGTFASLYVNGVFNDMDGVTSLTYTAANNLTIGVSNNLEAGTYWDGFIEEVMVFNITLSVDQILDIYNNQSARFAVSGTQEIFNESYMNITSGNNRVNVTTYIENNLGSNINLSVGYYDTDWQITEPQTLTSGIEHIFNITDTSTNLTLNYTFLAGNNTDPFYSPLIKENITFETWYEALDTCTVPVSGNWEIICSDNCTWNTNQNIPGNISMAGNGILILNANFTFTSSDQYAWIGSGCKLVINSGGNFR